MSVPDLNFGLSRDAVKYLRRKEILSYTGEFIQLTNPPFKLVINLGMYEANPFTEDDIRILLQKNFIVNTFFKDFYLAKFISKMANKVK
jgi:hypothetical protein